MYRIGVVIKDLPWTTVTGSIMSPSYSEHNEDTNLYDWSDGTGVLYTQFNIIP